MASESWLRWPGSRSPRPLHLPDHLSGRRRHHTAADGTDSEGRVRTAPSIRLHCRESPRPLDSASALHLGQHWRRHLGKMGPCDG